VDRLCTIDRYRSCDDPIDHIVNYFLSILLALSQQTSVVVGTVSLEGVNILVRHHHRIANSVAFVGGYDATVFEIVYMSEER
jgi:hypothetical protein